MGSAPRSLVLVALALGVVAVGLSALSLLRAPPPAAVNVGADGTIHERLERLEQQFSRANDRGGRTADGSRVRGAAAATPGSASVDERLAALESSVGELEEASDETESRVEALAESVRKGPVKAIQDATPTPEQVAELRKLVLDTEAEPRPRLLALRALARVPGGRTLEIARAMRKLFEESEDERTRTGVVALLQGVVDPELEPWLVETLLNDRFSSTRESATDTLSHYVGSQRVRDALADAAQNDTNHDVRADAQNALDKLDEREQD